MQNKKRKEYQFKGNWQARGIIDKPIFAKIYWC